MTNAASNSWRSEWRKLALLAAVFLLCVFLPVGSPRLHAALTEGLRLVRGYARGNVVYFLIPTFFIAGAIEAFVSKAAVVKYFGAKTKKLLSYGVASVSGGVLTVCSCAVLPLFAGIYRKGAGLGPATTFLYSGPAINLLAILLTARVLGPRLGVARAVGAIVFGIVIGLSMHALHGKREADCGAAEEDPTERFAAQNAPWGRTVALVGALAAVLIFANWTRSGDVRAVFLCCPGGLATAQVEGHIVSEADHEVVIAGADGSRHAIPSQQIVELEPMTPSVWRDVMARTRWVGVLAALWALLFVLMRCFAPDERMAWTLRSWGFAKRILPLLLAGVFLAGFLHGRPGHDGLIPSRFIEMLLGASPEPLLVNMGRESGPVAAFARAAWPVWVNLFAAILGAFMYFATLTEVPILQALLGAGMGQGPALALLLAGPALSLPNMLVVGSVLGPRKTLSFAMLVVVMATISGLLYGRLFG